MRADHVYVSLRVLSNLQEGQKLSTRNGLLSVDKKLNPVMRWLNGDNRSTTLMHVGNLVNEAIVERYHQELKAAIPGIESLKVRATFFECCERVATAPLPAGHLRGRLCDRRGRGCDSEEDSPGDGGNRGGRWAREFVDPEADAPDDGEH